MYLSWYMTPEQIAEVCHEANRVLTKHIGDVPVQPHWEEAPEDQRTSSIVGVNFALVNVTATAQQLHEAWCQHKFATGWVLGSKKDEVAKTHPALVPYSELPAEVRQKDAVFRAVVAALR